MGERGLIRWRGEFARLADDGAGANRGLVLPTMGNCDRCGGDVARAVVTDVDAVEVGRWKHLLHLVEDDHPVTGVRLDPARWPVTLTTVTDRAGGF